MTETIGNPLSWSVDHAGAVGKHLGAAATHIGHGDAGELEMPRIRHIAVRDLREVLRKGVEDFAACRTDVIFLCLLYPIIGGLLAWVAFHNNLLPLLFPITSGFALLGPIAAVGLYEMSRRREMGEEPDWAHALSLRQVAFVRGDLRPRAHARRAVHRLGADGERHLLRAFGDAGPPRSAASSAMSSPPGPAGP